MCFFNSGNLHVFYTRLVNVIFFPYRNMIMDDLEKQTTSLVI